MYSQPWSPVRLPPPPSHRETHREALAGHAAEEGLAAGGAVQHGVADDDVLGGVATEVDARRAHRMMRPPAQTLADVIVGRHRPDRSVMPLARGMRRNSDRRCRRAARGWCSVGQSFGMAVTACHLTGKHGADGTIDVAHVLTMKWVFSPCSSAGAGPSRSTSWSSALLEVRGSAPRHDASATSAGTLRTDGTRVRKSSPTCLPVFDCLGFISSRSAPTDQFVKRADARAAP